MVLFSRTYAMEMQFYSHVILEIILIFLLIKFAWNVNVLTSEAKRLNIFTHDCLDTENSHFDSKYNAYVNYPISPRSIRLLPEDFAALHSGSDSFSVGLSSA